MNSKTLTIVFLVLSSLCVFSVSQAKTSEKQQKAVLVTGATSGIGLRITEHLSQKGYYIYAGARKDADMHRLSKMNNVQAIRLDVNNQKQIADAVEKIRQAGRGLYGLVNNAGVVILGPLIETDEADMDFLLQVNLYGPYRITKAFAPLIIESKGRITTISSISGILSGKLFGPYSMSKHAIEAFADSLSAEMRQFDVRVSVVEPGNFESKIGDSFLKRYKKRNQSVPQTRYQEDWDRMLNYFNNRKQGADPILVAKAVEHALFSDKPKMRYMVVPNQREGEMTLRQAIKELVQLNQSHTHSINREVLIKMLDEELDNLKN